MAQGFFLFLHDKTTCGGKIIDGIDDHGHFGQAIACEGHAVTCGKHPGTYKISGGMGDIVHGKQMAGTLHSASTCPCKATFIHTSADSYEFNGETAVSSSPTVKPATASPASVLNEQTVRHKVRFKCADDSGSQLARHRYQLVFSDGHIEEGRIDNDGLTAWHFAEYTTDIHLNIFME